MRQLFSKKSRRLSLTSNGDVILGEISWVTTFPSRCFHAKTRKLAFLDMTCMCLPAHPSVANSACPKV